MQENRKEFRKFKLEDYNCRETVEGVKCIKEVPTPCNEFKGYKSNSKEDLFSVVLIIALIVIFVGVFIVVLSTRD